VNADELTKEAIFEGLKSGRCYAETTTSTTTSLPMPPDNLLKIESITVEQGPLTSTVTITSNWPAIYYWYTANSWPDQTVPIDGTPTPVQTTGTRWEGSVGGGVFSDTYTVTETDVFVRATLVATPSITLPLSLDVGGTVYTSPMRIHTADDPYNITSAWDDNTNEVTGLFNVRLAG